MAETRLSRTSSSCVTARDVARVVGLRAVAVESGAIWWEELRPEENGRVSIVCRRPGGATFELFVEELAAAAIQLGRGCRSAPTRWSWRMSKALSPTYYVEAHHHAC